MAINPYEQSVAVPGGGGVSSGTNVNLADVGGAISDLGTTLLRAGEPYHKQQALAQGKADAAKFGTIKNPDGTWSMPETPEGGVVYAAAFDEAKRTQYLLHVVNDGELRYNDLYNDPAHVDKTPEDLRTMAEADLQATLKSVDPSVQGEVFELLSREIRQRDLQRSTQYYRQNVEMLEKDLSATQQDAWQKALLKFGDRDEEGGAIEQAKGRAALEKRVKLLMAPESDLARYDASFGAARFGGTVLSNVRTGLAANEIDSAELDLFTRFLTGSEPEGSSVTINGVEYTGKAVRAAMDDPTQRAKLGSIISDEQRRLKAQEDEAERAAALDDMIDDIPDGGGRPSGMSEEEYSATVKQFAINNGINPYTPEGITKLFTRFREVPKFYREDFDNLFNLTAPEIERLRPVYETIGSILSRDGSSIPLGDEFLPPKSDAFMYHYSAARKMGASEAEAMDRARTAHTQGIEREGEKLTSLLIRNGQIEGEKPLAQLFDKLDDVVGAEWGDIGKVGQDAILLDVTQQVAMGVPFDKAVKSMGVRFKRNYGPNPFTLGAGRAGKPEWVPYGQMIPRINDVTNPNNKINDWIEPYVRGAINTWGGTQLPGVPDKSKLKLGQNVWLKATGRTTKEGGAQWMLVYHDNKGGEAVLMNKSGVPIMLDFNRAYRKQDKFTNDWLAARTASEDNLNRLKKQAGIVPGAMRSNPQAVAAYNKAQAEHDARFNIWRDGPEETRTMQVEGKTRQVKYRGRTMVRPNAERILQDVEPPKFERAITEDTGVPNEGGYAAFKRSIIAQETGGRYGIPNAEGSGAMGIGQVMPDTGRALAKRLGLAWRPDLMAGKHKEARDYQDKITEAAIREAWDYGKGSVTLAAKYYFGGSDRKKWGRKTLRYGYEVTQRYNKVKRGEG